MPGERVVGVYDCIGAGTGFVGLTDRRLILQDNSFVGKRVALTSVPYSRVCEFRGHDKAKLVHDTILEHML